MELYDSKRCQDLKQRIEDTDSIKENRKLKAENERLLGIIESLTKKS